MSDRFQLVLTSERRDRVRFPQVSQFEVGVNETANLTQDIANWFDPVYAGYPVVTFNPNTIVGTLPVTPRTYSGGTPSAPWLNTSDAVTLDNYYNGWTISDTGTGTQRVIEKYDASSNTATLTSPFPPSWSAGGTYTIDVTNLPVAPSYQEVSINPLIILGAVVELPENYYVESYLICFDTFLGITPIVGYTGSTNLLVLQTAPATYNPQSYKLIMRAAPGAYGNVMNTTPPNVMNITGGSNVDNMYVNWYIFAGYTTQLYSSIVTGYNAATGDLTVAEPIPPAFMAGTYVLIPPSYDNYHTIAFVQEPMMYQEQLCYSVSVPSVIIPNLILTTGTGGRAVTYPYVLLSLRSESDANSIVLYSNDPIVSTAQWICPVIDTSAQTESAYLRFSAAARQTIKIRPIDTLIISIRLPDGELFEVSGEEYSPAPPNPRIQITVTFDFTRVVPRDANRRVTLVS